MILITRSAKSYSLPVVVDSTLPKTDQVALADAVRVELEDGMMITVPAGFVTDFHSTPTWTWSALPAFDNKTNLAAVVHDWLYMNQPEGFTRKRADDIFLELMNRFSPDTTRRNLLYYQGVRAFGWRNWNQYSKQQIG